MPYRRSYTKKRRRRWDSVIFYAGTKSDGTPRGWTIIDLVITTFCVGAVFFALFFFMNWIWDISFMF